VDIVIPYIRSTKDEIRYALRSVEKFAQFGVGNIWIIGDLTPTFQNVKQVVVENIGNSREHKIFRKIARACRMDEVSDDFLMMNDDHFFLKPIESIPYWYSGTLEEIAAYRRYKDGYTKAIQNTHKYLRDRGLQTTHFDIHTPIVYNKKRFLELERLLDWEVAYGYAIKSLYCNIHPAIKGEYLSDCKLKDDEGVDQMYRKIQGRPVFSTGDLAFPNAGKLLQELYPDKCKWEI
jgi:hypothetical protein